MYTDEVEVAGTEAKGGNRLVQLSDLKTMIDQALGKFKKKTYSHVPETAEKTIIDGLKMCAVEG